MYQALYRKWRPQTFDDVIGQEPITTTLKNQVAGQKLSHAYLFCGSRGTGKTSCSKILAKAVNCLDPQQGNPCCKCDICVGIEQGSILDVTEIDAASNSGVDDIRGLRAEANFTPVSTKYRVYIIDETHMLSTAAFNALLKIMEEPPPHVLFILATTEIHKVPATILSRCQRFDFRRIPSVVMATRLESIAIAEGLRLAPDAAQLIARLSDGAMRDALSLLDLCVAGDEEITVELVESRSGLAGQDYLDRIAAAALEEDGGKALSVLGELWKYTVDYQRFCQQLLGFYRNLLVVKSTKDAAELIEGITPKELERLKESAEGYSLSRIFYSITVLSDTLNRMYRTPMRRTEMEMGLLKLCNPAMDSSPEALSLRIEKLEHAPRQIVTQTTSSAPSTDEIVSENAAPPLANEADQNSSTPDSRVAVSPFEEWPKVLDILQTQNKALYGSLFYSKAYITGDFLLVDAGSELFAEIVRTDEYARESLRTAAQSITGQTYRLGPYNSSDFAVEEESNPLDELEKTAHSLGISVDITNK